MIKKIKNRKIQSVFLHSHKRLPLRGIWSSLQKPQHQGTALPLLNAIHAQQCWTFSNHAELQPLSLFLCRWKGYQQGNYSRNVFKKIEFGKSSLGKTHSGSWWANHKSTQAKKFQAWPPAKPTDNKKACRNWTTGKTLACVPDAP